MHKDILLVSTLLILLCVILSVKGEQTRNTTLIQNNTTFIKTKTIKTTYNTKFHYKNDTEYTLTVNTFQNYTSDPVLLNTMFIGFAVWGGLFLMMTCVFSFVCFCLSKQVNTDLDGQDDENPAYLLVPIPIDTNIIKRYLYIIS